MLKAMTIAEESPGHKEARADHGSEVQCGRDGLETGECDRPTVADEQGAQESVDVDRRQRDEHHGQILRRQALRIDARSGAKSHTNSAERDAESKRPDDGGRGQFPR